jgi:cytochrome oxidase Cu insertion factor (SCO1/SenC/PrrC family)
MSERKINPWSVWALIAIMLGGLLVYYNWVKTVNSQMAEGRPKKLRPVDKLRTDDHRGAQAELFDQDGKLYLVGYFYTADVAEAVAVCRRMETMYAPFAAAAKIRLVGVTMAPDVEKPAVLKAFAEANGFTGDEWTFITGDHDRLRKFMNKEFRYPGHKKPEELLEGENDLYARELRITLVDGNSEIRGVYWEGIAKGELLNDKHSEHDIRYILTKEMGMKLPEAEKEAPETEKETPDDE